MFFVDVILPIPLNQTFTYSINQDEAAFLRPGMRVAVPFGKTKVYTAIVHKVHVQAPAGYETKSIDHILDQVPIITDFQLRHWKWMASYYMCSLGVVVKAALPSAFLLESETVVKLVAKTEVDHDTLTDDEYLVYEALQHQSSIHINGIRSILDRKNVVSVIQKLIEKGIVEVEETIYEKYSPKLKRYLRLAAAYSSEEKLRELLDTLNRAPKQSEVLMTFFTLKSQSKKPIEASTIQKKSNASSAVIKSLIDKGVFEEYFIQKDRIEYSGKSSVDIKTLNEPQQIAFHQIKDSFKAVDVVLLHGVTSSGKTEIYAKLIEETLESGKQILYMLPEIALTTQLISRLQRYFGERISVYHSRFSVNERVEVWKSVLDKKPKSQIIVGARSALFLPFSNLGLVVVDEEHEPSFKQYNPAPRYNARDSAVVLANLHGAKLLMGSATPSLESYYNAKIGKYGLVELKKRFGNVQMPEIELVDIREKNKKKQMTGHFSDRLLEEMHEVLKNGEQIILFQNRRGFSPVVECTTCGVAPQCRNCDVSLTYHQNKNQLRCHYCGYHTTMMLNCIACGSQTLDTKGFGTEQIETELKTLFPKNKIARMDQDTTRGKHAYSKLIDALDNQEIDILVGTQMLAKGLDFRNIGLVGVMNADSLLHFPDFRAHERSFQLLQQVAGRAGRTEKRGKVLIQTFNPYHQILRQVSVNDYGEMSKEQLHERYQYKYPPFFRIIKIEFKDKSFSKVESASHWFAKALKSKFGENILGPEQPPVGRVRNKFIFNVLMKIPKDQSLEATKKYIANVERSFASIKDFASVRINVDVDSY
ncbi:primosomal protein N' [Aequorivita sp. H23M31]|uniref:Replication restart protein PriA n=1 Tax=Aequorivita ciconiae TaxID=2494375 RepID=A0A410FZK2_9FLAO|nr:primosomal protein N' [Aequorivita sp. H23M31]QAA80436.1 primosomal protein N' [Aequorivita sp. H23M31]